MFTKWKSALWENDSIEPALLRCVYVYKRICFCLYMYMFMFIYAFNGATPHLFQVEYI
jgi:hypothetical protein